MTVFSIFFFLITISLVYGSWFSDFFNPGLSHAPVFSGSQLYGIDVGLEQIKGSIECFGDFNNDKYTDLFILSEDRSTITVYLWNKEVYAFHSLESAKIYSNEITNAAAGDFNYDGKLDLMVVGTRNGTSDTYVRIFFGELDKFYEEQGISDTSGLNGDLLVMDANADLKLDLFGSINGQRGFWINNGKGTFHFTPQEGHSLSLPNSNAFVDIDGDCLSDLVVTSCSDSSNCEGTKQIEVWLNKLTNFDLDKTIQLPKGAGQVSFADLNGDGSMDIIYPVCYPTPNCTEQNTIHIIYNNQIPLCSFFSSGSGCRSSQALCEPDPNYKLGHPSTSSTKDFVIIGSSNFGSKHFLWDKNRSITLRMGDYNLDGYPDILVPLVNEKGISSLELWENVDCNIQLCGTEATHEQRRAFSKVNEGVGALVNIPNPYAATFFDLDESGVLDILVLCADPNTKTIQAVFNNFFNDAFFLKTMGLNGYEWGTFASSKPYGVNLPGPVFKFTVSELSGTKRVVQGVQLQQSGNLALQTPYILFGLGRTSNYIEEFYMGVTINNQNNAYWHKWICIIPNSQLVAIPYKPTDPNNWLLELYIKTSGLTLWAVVAVASTLLVTGAVIYFFSWREKREDNLLKQKTAHLFSFDAL